VHRKGKELAIITVWVDDLLMFATSDHTMEAMKNDIRSEWEMTDLGEPTKIVRIKITLKEQMVTISQRKYIENILKKEGLKHANAVSTLLDVNSLLEPNPEGGQGDQSNSYARLLGELQFLANTTRPDITFAVNRLAAYTANPSLQHMSALK
jgi:Reverse transcriptase (RNA-dependent DNA polymerase)